ncbi:hypothetical protein [Corynebacterium halotolerans]|uniref:Cell division protein FtsL n=1 Tax=Corynebacterium halotolerans YIM 70093 = DSM 44683 TaxID=1121362 RepID=M1P8A8_9CORY|nr:hypothetical protein [Corynebacterium halotolerans]AGF72901.1 hypothetical protein A605_09495 [Corynebacterium halotolerans YIM 70093 = DSM 44683]
MTTPTTRTTARPNPDRKGQRTMGVSRDFTTGAGPGSTAVLEPGAPDRAGARTRAREELSTREQGGTRTRTRILHQPQTPKKRPYQRRLGSRQVVSVRGRRVATTRRTTLLAKLGTAAIGLLVSGVAIAMWLSGVSTQQTFQIQQLVSQDQQLSNQLETLNRDLENIRSSAEIARRATEMGMALPAQPGILEVREGGEIVEERPADPATRPLVDLNGQPIRPGQASSDPDATSELTDNLEAVPEGHRLPAPEGAAPPAQAPAPALAPYAPNVPAAPPEAQQQSEQQADPQSEQQAGETGQ